MNHPEPASFRVWTDLEVRFRDCDPMGHVNNAVFATYMEVGRQTYWRQFIKPQDITSVPFIVGRIEIDYRSPAFVGETLRVSMRTGWIGRHSFGTEYEIREKETGRLVVEAKSVEVTYDYRTGAVIPVPDELRTHLETIEGREIPTREQPGQ